MQDFSTAEEVCVAFRSIFNETHNKQSLDWKGQRFRTYSQIFALLEAKLTTAVNGGGPSGDSDGMPGHPGGAARVTVADQSSNGFIGLWVDFVLVRAMSSATNLPEKLFYLLGEC